MNAARWAVPAVFLSLLAAAPAGAISNGTLDPGHTYVGMLGLQADDGRWRGQCSGFYGGGNTFVTAGHCLNWLESEGIAADDLGVTFDTEITWNQAAWQESYDAQVTSDNEWHRAVSYAFDDEMDFGAVRLASVPDGLRPARWPALGQLDGMEARGGLRPRAVFDSVGYGLVPGPVRGAQTQYDLAPGRLLATSRFQKLSDDWLNLTTNDHIEDNGGPCYGDSGGPSLIHGTDIVAAFSAGGHRSCVSYASNLRLDTPAARDFYGTFIALE